ncbi:MAG: type II toxin-antitoxin system PemK/MazF family toxin [Woronichinia naegeliana WA131]|jgi:mRNA interferase MazF|uniref:Type II toxin-antitoxin system PemK/MazF family toxin n=1 Tax=Woronichinia naegeliana WA131 TaxID=2824559 RepID=A0A977PVT1_9CYAN|nr:MAG: type II toxin-antitoxin system PemK/MazF family toxin [Woronichinia naegeliana WA131]
MKEGNIVLTPIPQSNQEIKNRPALILRIMPKYQDFLICGISSQLKQYIRDFDEIITSEDNDFEASGLIKISVIRLGFLTVIPSRQIIGSIGSISTTRHRRLLQNLSQYLSLENN